MCAGSGSHAVEGQTNKLQELYEITTATVGRGTTISNAGAENILSALGKRSKAAPMLSAICKSNLELPQ